MRTGHLIAIVGLMAHATLFTQTAAAQPRTSTPEILVMAFHGKQWQVRYDFDAPVTQMIFPRSPDASRIQTWLADQGFEIVSSEQGDVARRKDRSVFQSVRFRMDPVYRELPKDYAPFSPFGDGGTLFHTGRLFACAQVCADDAEWQFDLWADPEDSIVVKGETLREKAQWKDRDDGRVVYIGKSVPQRRKSVVAVIDEALPDNVRGPLLKQLPEFMQLFAAKLGALPTRPMLFASYDTSHAKGWGRQGGVLPGQVFTHFYGNAWPEETKKPDFANDLAWHFAHEAAHLYQRQQYATAQGDAWIHEGAAEAFAVLALRSLHSNAETYVARRIDLARSKCRDNLGEGTIADAIERGVFDAAYNCGLLINLTIDAGVREATKQDGLYAVWREYLKIVRNPSSPVGEAAYLQAIARSGDAQLVQRMRTAIGARRSEFEASTTF